VCFDLFVVNGVDGFGFRILVHEVDPGPVGLSLCISAGFVFFHPLLAFLLPVSLDLAKAAKFAIPVIVVSA
jgi:hypothetical protein